MGNIVLKRVQLVTEGSFDQPVAYSPSSNLSVYQGGTAPAATRRVAVEDASEFEYANLTYEAPEENRGTYAAYYVHILHKRMSKGKFSSLLYPDDIVWWLRGAISGSPTVVTLPSTPVVLLAATAIAATMSLTSQPNAQTDAAASKLLAVTLSNAAPSTTAVTITITGTDVNGNPLTEALNFSAGTTTPSRVGGGAGATTVTLYTQNYFKTVNASGITTSAQPASDLVAVGGLNGFLWTFNPDMATSTLVSQTAEFFDGSTPWQLPGAIIPKFDFNFEIGKSVKCSGDLQTKDILPMVGGLTALTDHVLPATSSYTAKYYSDPIGVVPGTTQVNARLAVATLGIENALALGKAADGTPNPTFVARKRYKTSGEMTLIFNNGQLGSEDPADFGAFNNTYQSRTVMVALPAVAYLPCGQLTGTLASLGWPAQLGDASGKGGLYGCTLAHAGKFTVAASANLEGRLAVKLKHDMEVDLVGMGVAYSVQLVNRINPNMI